MFENAGMKIKMYGKAVFWIMTILFWLMGLITFVTGVGLGNGAVALASFFSGLLMAAIGTLAAFLSALMIVGFGELVESSTANQKTNEEILKTLKEKNEIKE